MYGGTTAAEWKLAKRNFVFYFCLNTPRMKKTIMLIMLALISLSANAQNDYSDAKYSYHFDAALEKNLLKKDNKVFIDGNNDNTTYYAAEMINKWQYWKQTKNRSKADFIMHLVNNGGFDAFMCYAVFIDPATDKVFYKTPLVNTFMRFTFQGQKAAVKKLFRDVRHHVSDIE